jgi:hypothetical protein
VAVATDEHECDRPYCHSELEALTLAWKTIASRTLPPVALNSQVNTTLNARTVTA